MIDLLKIVSRRALLCVLCFSWLYTASAQVDTDFWFAVPYLTNAHSTSLADGKGKICITSFADTTHITISQPAITQTTDPKYFAPITYTLPPYTSHDFDVRQGSINRANQSGSGRFGIHIESDYPVSAYFAQVNENSEIYTLKGRNALGTSFLVPQQSHYGNAFSASPTIEIVATENNTTVSITTPVTTYTKSSTTNWTITLQRGETYTIRASNSSTASHLGGTIITSDKPIAVNTSDDSLASSGQDLVGEQLVPSGLAGLEYIAIKHDSPNEYLYLFTFPGRPIMYTVNGGPIQTMAAGASARIALSSRATYVMATDEFVAFQITADGGELGATVLPRLDCTGSYEVAYKKRFGSQILTLMVKTPYTGSFMVNGTPVNYTFQTVPGSPAWSYAYVRNPAFDANGIIRIANADALFHASIMDYGGGTNSYGYFSGYNYVTLQPYASSTMLIVGDTLELGIQMPDQFGNITWTCPNGTTLSGAPVFIPITSTADAGDYVVTATSVEGCPILQDNVSVNIQVVPPLVPEPTCPEPVYAANENVTVCDTLLPYRWRGHTCMHQGTYYDTLYTTLSNGLKCDSVYYTLNLTVEHCEAPHVDPPEPPRPRLTVRLYTESVSLCDGDDQFTLSYQIEEGNAQCMSVSIDTDTMWVDLPDNQGINIQQIPLIATPEFALRLTPFTPNLHMTIVFYDKQNDYKVSFTIPVDVLYDPEGVFTQKWDNVLAIYSPSYSAYGLTWTGEFQWYKNGMPLSGETGSYLHLEAATFDYADYYQLRVTRLSDGVTMLTCPFYPHPPVYQQNVPGIYDVMGRPIQSAPKSGFYIQITEDKIEKLLVR